MGKLSSGIFGGVSGKVGNLTGSSWKGIQVVKSRPQSVAYPGTAGQVAQTTNMSAIVSFCKLILSSWIKPLWDRSAVKMSGYNAFVRANIAEFADGVIDDYSTLVMSQGTMASTPISGVSVALTYDEVNVTWEASSVSGLQNSTDIAFACVINETTQEVNVSSSAIRSESSIDIPLLTLAKVGDVLHIYLAFKRSNGTVISANSYSSITVI
jgi:hypothetical protein